MRKLHLPFILAVVFSHLASAQEENATQPATLIYDRSKLEIAPPMDSQSLLKADINKFIPEDQRNVLLAGPDEIIYLKKEELTSSPKGVIIMLPDWQQHSASPKAINHLRQSLPEHGWVTIAIQPPKAPYFFPKQQTEQAVPTTQNEDSSASTDVETSATTDTAASIENEPSLAQYKRQLTSVMNAIMELAQDYPGIHVVVAEGINGALLTQLYEDKTVDKPNALILLSSFTPEVSANTAFSERVAKADYPILDLYLSKDNLWVSRVVEERAQLAKKHIKVVYRQQEISAKRPGFYPPVDTDRAIRSWLKAIGW